MLRTGADLDLVIMGLRMVSYAGNSLKGRVFRHKCVPGVATDKVPHVKHDCPSSDNLGHQSVLSFGGSGSFLIEFMRFQFCGASAA